MRRPFVVGVAVAGLCLVWVGQAGALPTPVSSAIYLRVFANADFGGTAVGNTDTDSQGATTNPLAATASATSVFGAASATVHASGAATWVNPAQGQVLLFDIGWETVNVTDWSVGTDLGNGWTYSFMADATGTFTLDWGILASGTDPAGLTGFFFGLNGANEFLNINTSGILTRPIIAGQAYDVRILNNGNALGSLGTRTADMDGTFNFSITATTAAVPAPASFVLLGVGLLAAVLVRRRAV